MAKKKNIITAKSQKFLEKYLNNASPTGFETVSYTHLTLPTIYSV